MYFSILYLGHVLSDFLLQPKYLRNAKMESSKVLLLQPATLFHVAIIFIVTLVIALLEGALNLNMFLAIVLTSIAHYFIDYWKNLKRTIDANIFLIDQLFHFVSIVASTILLNLWDLPLKSNEIVTMVRTSQWEINHFTQINFLAISFISLIWGTQYFLHTLLHSKRQPSPIYKDQGVDSLADKASISYREHHIAYMERIMILLFVLQKSYIAVGLLLIAKTFIRFEKLKDENYQEVFIYSTGISFTCALLFSSLYRYFLLITLV